MEVAITVLIVVMFGVTTDSYPKHSPRDRFWEGKLIRDYKVTQWRKLVQTVHCALLATCDLNKGISL